MKFIRDFKLWAEIHPWRFAGVALAFMALATALDFLFGNPADYLVMILTLMAAVFGTLVIIVGREFPMILGLCVALAAGRANAQEEPQANAAGVGVAIVVVCVGGYCIYKVIRFCQKNFAKDKPANTNEFYFVERDNADEYGASWNNGSLGSCFQENDARLTARAVENGRATKFALNVFVASPTELRRTMTADRRSESFQTWLQFQAEVASHGLFVSGQNDGSQYFSRNGIPVSAGEVPIRFDTMTGEVIHDRGGELVPIVIEASTDLEHWQRLASVQHGVGEGFQIADVSTEEFQFYRARIGP